MISAIYTPVSYIRRNNSEPPKNFEWTLEMQVEDLDGNLLRIGSDAEKDKQ